MDPPRIERGSPPCKGGILTIGQRALLIIYFNPSRFLKLANITDKILQRKMSM